MGGRLRGANLRAQMRSKPLEVANIESVNQVDRLLFRTTKVKCVINFAAAPVACCHFTGYSLIIGGLKRNNLHIRQNIFLQDRKNFAWMNSRHKGSAGQNGVRLSDGMLRNPSAIPFVYEQSEHEKSVGMVNVRCR